MRDHDDKHILIVVENLPVPLDRRVWLEATTLVRASYRVSVISPMGRGWNAPFEVLEGVNIHRHPAQPEAQSGALAYAREYSSAIGHWFRLARLIWDKAPFDAIQGCNPPDLIFLLALRYRRRGVRYLFDHHDVCPELYEAKFARRGVMYRLMRLLERSSFATASVSIATNDSFRAVAIARGKMDPADVFVVRSAPMIDRFLPGPGNRALRKGCGTVFGYVGVIGQQEGMDLLVLAADHLIRQLGQGDVHFVIIGFGPARATMEQEVEDLGLAEHFSFVGALYGDALVSALNAVDIGLAPDPKNPMNDISTMNKVVEYMTLEKPVIQFDLTEGRVSAGDASLYATANDPIDFAAKMDVLIRDRDTGHKMGQEGRARVHANLSWDHSEPQLLAAYARLFAKRTTRIKIGSEPSVRAR